VLTLNQIVSQITNLATAHNQIAESGVGDFAEWQAKERSYPILWVFHESTAVNQMEIAFSIRLICADRVIVGEEGDDTQGHEQEVISDTLLVLLDFLAYFQQNHSQPYDVVTSATIDPFTERLNDRLAGNSVTIQIRQPFDWNKCQIPQTGASIPPTVDGLTLYNFCDPAVIARLTDEQVACLIAQYNEPCEDATITINSAPFASVPSGGSLNVPVKNSAGTLRGSKVGADWVVPDGSVPVTNTAATPITTIAVPSGNSVPYVIPNVAWTDSDGSAESTPYGQAIVCTLAAGGSVSVAVSDATPGFGDVITITATPTGFTPTSYLFFAFDGVNISFISEQVGAVVNWQVSIFGIFDIYAVATDGTVNGWDKTEVSATGLNQETYDYMIETGIPFDGTVFFPSTTFEVTGMQIWLAVDVFIGAAKTQGWWGKLISLYFLRGGAANSCRWNAVNPLDTDAAFRLKFFGGVTFDGSGITGNDINAYAQTFITPSTHLGLNTAGVTWYCRNNINQGGGTANVPVGAFSGAFLGVTYELGIAYHFVNEIAYDSIANQSSGIVSVNRTAVNSKGLWKNGVKIASSASASTSLPANTIGLLAAGTAQYYTNANLGLVAVHDGMTDTDMANIHAAIQTFNTAMNI
jgi:hypothetical protein